MKKIRLAVILLLLYGAAKGQKTDVSHTITGRVQDSVSRQDIAFATVSLLAKDKKQVKTLLTQPDGSFVFNLDTTRDSCFIAVNMMGYSPRLITVKPGAGHSDIGLLLLRPLANQLKTVTVMGVKPLIQRRIDRLIYEVQADPDSRSSSLLEIMPKVPLLSVDGEDNLMFRGRANFRVLIDGKPSGMLERKLKDVLRTMPASTIQSIEVITTPGARYDAEGIGGIINIVTVKKLIDGYNATVNTNWRAPLGGPGIGASLNAKSGKLGINALTGGSMFRTPGVRGLIRRQTNGTLPTELTQLNTRQSKSRNFYAGLELSYEIDSLQLLSGKINPNGNDFRGTTLVNSQRNDGQFYDMVNSNAGNGSGLDASFNYQLGFKNNKNRLLAFAYRFYDFTDYQNDDQTFSRKLNYPEEDYRQINNSGSHEHTLQADYVQPFKHLILEFGIKGIWRMNYSDYRILVNDPATGQFTEDTGMSNNFEGGQNVYSAYHSLQYRIKDWELKAGVRLEHTAISANFISGQTQISRNYMDIIPSVAIRKSAGGGKESWNIGFSQRVQRPGISLLNPFVDRSNPGAEYTGNTAIRPAKESSVEAGYGVSAKGNLTVSLGYNWTDNMITEVTVVDPASSISRNSYDNSGNEQRISLNISADHPLAKGMTVNLNGDIAYNYRRGQVNGIPVNRAGWTGGLTLSTGLRMAQGWRTGASVSYYNGNFWFQGRSNAFLRSSFNLSKTILKDQLTFSVFANNPFSKFRTNHIEVYGPQFSQTNDIRLWFRAFGGSLNYRFGKLNGGIRKSKKSITNSDLVNN